MAKDKKTPVEKESATAEIKKKFKQSPLLYIGSVVILVLVTVTFIGGDLLSGGFGAGMAELTFGHYDGVPISWMPGNAFSQSYDRVLRFYQSHGLSLDDPQIMARVWRQAYEMALVHTAILRIMDRSNFSVPQSVVDRHVAQLPQFQQNGRFSPALFNMLSEASRIAVWEQTREELTMMTFYHDLFSMSIPQGEIDFIANMASQKRNFDMVSFSVDDFPASEALIFAEENVELFTSIHLSRITANSERDARRIRDTIVNGVMLFEDAARSQSLDFLADRGGDMGSRFFFELNWDIPNLEDRREIFALSQGELSNVVNVGGGWAFFRVEEEAAAADFEDELIMDRVLSYIRGFQRGRMEDWAIGVANEFVARANESGFAEAASLHFMQRQSFGPLPINIGNNRFFTTLESFAGGVSVPGFNVHDFNGLAHNENFWRIAFSTDIDMPTEPIVQGATVFVFSPTAEVEADEADLENVGFTYRSQLNNMIEQALPAYFLNNPRMRDDFWEVYFRFFM